MREIAKGTNCTLRISVSDVGKIQNAKKIDTHIVSPSGVVSCVDNAYDELMQEVVVSIDGALFNEVGPYSVNMRIVYDDETVVVPTIAFAEVVDSNESECEDYAVIGIEVKGGNVTPSEGEVVELVERKEFDALEGRVEDLEQRGGGGNSDNNYTDADKALVQTIPDKVGRSEFKDTLQEMDNSYGEIHGNLYQEIETKADKKGYYKDLSVGMADNLVGRGDVQDAHINFRPSAGVDNITDGAARIERIKGNSVVWNNFAGDYIETSTIANLQSGAHIVKGHKYLFHRTITSGILYLIQKVDGVEKYDCKLSEGVDSLIYTALYDLSTPNISLYNTIQVQGGIHLIDLTQMFGVGNEPTSYEEYLQRKPMNIEDEYAYNTGTLVDMKVDSLISTSDNAYDYTKGYARVMGGYKYDITANAGATLVVSFYADEEDDNEEREIAPDSEGKYTFPANGICYVNGNFASQSDICVCLNHSYNKPHPAYQQEVKDLSWIWEIQDSEGNLLFPEGMRSASAAPNNKWHIYDEIFFNKTIKKWTLIKRIGYTTVTKDTPINKDTNAQCAFTVNKQYLQLDGTPKTYGGCTTNNYGLDKVSAITSKGLYFNNALLIFNLGDDSNVTTVEALKSLLETRPLQINYELAEPIVVELDYPTEETNMDYRVWDFGTEEAIVPNNVPSAPFRADINYEPNAVDDLRWAVAEIRNLKAQLAQMQTSTTNLTE